MIDFDKNILKSRKRNTSSEIENVVKKDLCKNLTEQDVTNFGVRHICITKELWDSYPLTSYDLEFYDYKIRYNNEGFKKYNFSKIDEDYYDVLAKMKPYCTCGGKAATILNGIDPKSAEQVQIYNQCPIAKMMCIRKVLYQKSLPIPQIANDFFQFYLDNYHQKFMDAVDKFFFITPHEVFSSIKTYDKQLEVLPYLNRDICLQNYQMTGHYEQHNKQQLDTPGAKVRQICNPEPNSKFITLLFEKPLRSVMYEVFGHQYAVGLSNAEKAKEITEMLKKKYNYTLDCSGFDNSHNKYLRQPWDYLIKCIKDKYGDRIKDFVLPHIFEQEFSKISSKIDYNFIINKKKVKYCTLDIGDKLASGSVYTTVLNTFLMLLLIHFAMKTIDKNKNENTVSGDDALGCTNTEKKTIGTNLFSVFGFKKNNFFNNIGVMLKYCYISDDPNDPVPCSLDTFICPKCGVKLVRHFFKYMTDTFVSIKYEKKFKMLGIPKEYFEQLIYEGEMAWAKGLRYPEMVFSPLNHGIDIKVISNFIGNILKNKTKQRFNLDSVYSSMYNEYLQIKGVDKSEIALNLINIVSNETYIKERKIQNFSCCSDAYDLFLLQKYGIDSAFIQPFYAFKKKKKVFIDGELVEIDNRYVPYEILKRCKYQYEKHLESVDFPVDRINVINNIIYKNLDRLEEIPTNYFESKPDTIDKRIKEVEEKFLELIKMEKPFDAFIQNFIRYRCVLTTLYNVDNYVDFQTPLSLELFYQNKKNTYYDFTIKQGTLSMHFTLDPPMFDRGKRLFMKPKKTLSIEAERDFYKKNINKENNVQKLLQGTPLKNDLAYYRKLPQIKLPEFNLSKEYTNITQLKNEYITYKRFFEESDRHNVNKARNLIKLEQKLNQMTFSKD